MEPPVTPSERILELDALRGLAVIGIALMNVYVFALPAQAYYNPIAWGGDQAIDRLVWVASFLFVEDKFRTLFAMLFGAGCAILLERAHERKWQAHFARMLVLFVIGLVHATLLASNDVLRAYALAGLALPFLVHLAPRPLIAIAIGLMVVHVAGGILTFGAAVLDWARGRVSSDAMFFVENNFGANPSAIQFMLEQGRESLSERIDRRILGIPDQLSTIVGSIPINLAAMVLGVALWKDGMLGAKWRVFRLQRLAAICGVLALPPLAILAWWVSSSGFPGALAGVVALVLSAPFDMALGLAYAAFAIALFGTRGPIVQRLAAVGRLSLTNYVMTSIVLSAVFASWGLGLFGQVSRAGAFALAFVPIALMMVWSPVWAEKIGQGPFETVWRWAAKRIGG